MPPEMMTTYFNDLTTSIYHNITKGAQAPEGCVELTPDPEPESEPDSEYSDSELDTESDTETDTEPVPEPDNTVYKYGNECRRRNQDKSLCTDDCLCSWSWPIDDPERWRSADATCRCKPEEPQPEVPEITWGHVACNVTNLKCGTGCRECFWSWEATDTGRWAGDTAACRCKN